mgnify:CR=1 FL=1
MITAYVMNKCQPRPLKRLYDRRETMLEKLKVDYLKAKLTAQEAEIMPEKAPTPVLTYPCGTPRMR